MDRQGGTRTLSGAKFCIISPRERATLTLISSRKERIPREGSETHSRSHRLEIWVPEVCAVATCRIKQPHRDPSAGGHPPQPRTGFPHRGLLPEPPQCPQISLCPDIPTASYTLSPGSFSLSNWSFSVPNSHPRSHFVFKSSNPASWNFFFLINELQVL